MFDIEIAGIKIRIHNHRKQVFRQCMNYILVPDGGFTEEQLKQGDLTTPGDPDFEVDTTKAEILAERKASVQENGFPVNPGYCESLCVYRKIALGMINYDAFLMHSSVIVVDGEAYAFAAKSGTGKSTQTLIWKKEFGERAVILNGDKPILRFFSADKDSGNVSADYTDRTDLKERVPATVLYACGTPWNGKENLGCNMKAPLRAVIFVERSPENHIRRMTQEEVSDRLFNQLLMPEDKESMVRFLGLIDLMLKTTEFYLLQCNMEQEAARTAWEGIHQCYIISSDK